ncbi:trypsin-like serine protease [Streptacidiphilus sp. 4-A2]|nr:trypsin-like serine protease [Streptacidiphilus sp. 4-A2]
MDHRPGGRRSGFRSPDRLPAQALEGTQTLDPAYGFTARLDIGDGLRSCTGTLIDNQWILTAASCFADDPATPRTSHRSAQAPTTAIIGRTDLSGSTGTSRRITKLIPRQDRDLVLAQLDSRVPGIQPLPLTATAPAAGQTWTAAGHGRTKDTWVPNLVHTAP